MLEVPEAMATCDSIGIIAKNGHQRQQHSTLPKMGHPDP